MIRKAKTEDSLSIANLMLLAMKDIVYSFIGAEDHPKAVEFLYTLVQQTGNQYSFENTWVAEEGGIIVGSLTAYDGADLEWLRKPVLTLLAKQYHRIISPEMETEAGEIYIDTIAVSPAHQGKGWGTALVKFLIEETVFQKGKTLGLLVAINNPKAESLYLQLGFKKVGKKVLMGHLCERLQMKAS